MLCVIDDCKTMHLIYDDYLAKFTHMSFANGKAFIESIVDDAIKPTCVVIDAVMPFLSGTDVIRWLQSHDISCPILLSTSLEGEEFELLANQLNVEYIYKGDDDFQEDLIAWVKQNYNYESEYNNE